MTEAIINFFRELLGNDYLTTFIISIIPIVELRGAIPVAFEMGMTWWQALGLAYAGSIVIVPVLLLLLKPILNLMKKVKIFARLANTVEAMFQEKAAKIAKKIGGGSSSKKEDWIKMIGVFAFVALPIPLTGVWTGSAVAVFLGLSFWKSLASIMLGNLTAGAIVTLLSVFFKPYLDTILMVFFILVIVIVVFYIIMLSIRMIKSKKKENAAKAIGATITDLDVGAQDVSEQGAQAEQDNDVEEAQPSNKSQGADGQLDGEIGDEDDKK